MMNNIVELINKLPREKREILEKQIKVDGSKYNIFPLSFAQKRLWFLDRFEANKSVYNIPSAYKITGNLNYDILEKAVNTIIERHEILRTIFIVIDQEPFQVINSDIKISIPVIDLSSKKGKENEIREILFKEASQHFNLTEGPLLSIKLLKVQKDQHIVALTMHHIISDGWSMSILIREVIALYNSFAKGKPSPLPALKIQYADFAKWQNNYLQGEKFEEQFDYWKEKLKDIPQAIDLPFDKPRPPHQSHKGDHLRFELPKVLSTKLAELARQYDITLFMLVLAAFDVLLSKYSGQDDILIGTPIAGRNRPETESLIGFFINTLVLRTDLSANPTFEELLDQVKETSLGAFANQDLPFEKLIEAVQPERNLNIPPIFQVLFTFQNLPLAKVKVADLEFEPVEVDNKTVKYDLTLSLEETPEGIRGGFGYNTDLFEKDTIEKMAEYFQNLLSKITEEQTQKISEISILSEDDKNKILYEWNRTEKEYDLNKTIHQLFEVQAKSTPDSIAIVQPPNSIEQQLLKEITYDELNSLSNKIANYVMAKGIKKGSIIGICYDRTIEQIASVLGILKAGCAYLPLDTKYPNERIAYMIQDSGTEVVITHSKYKTKFDTKKELIFIDSVLDENFTIPGNTVNIDVKPNDLAYIIYTSGSTGKPKGVAVEHKNLVNYISAAKEIFNLTKEDRVLQFASISFDAAAEEIYPALTSGSTLVLRNDTMIGSSFAFVTSITKLGVSVLDLPTAYWHQLVSELEINDHTLPEQIRLVIIGGERAIPNFILKWQKKYSHIRLLNTYGPTETTVVATIWELPPVSEKQPLTNEVPIGKPVPNVQTYILDKYMTPVPVGVGGELFIGGVGVARGYLNREDLTSEKFVTNRFAPNKTSRLYRTGDRVRFLTDGNIEFLGRLDQQVKIRGFRIELGEIENEILKQPGIKDAVVNIISNQQGEKSLVAYFVAKKSMEISGPDTKKLLQKTLPDYMIPAFFVKVDNIPLTPSGKVDFQSLPDPSGSRPDLEKPYIEARNPLEKILVNIWKRTLQIDKVGIHDNFFELGGDSLKAAILINRLQQELDVILYVVVLFDAQTIVELSRYLTQKYPEQVLKICKKYYPEENVDFIKSEKVHKKYDIDEDKIKNAKRILSEKTADKKAEIELHKNIHIKLKRAIFIVSAPRSGSTLLRVILAGHSKIFSPPELALLNFRTLKERTETFTGRDEGWMEGLYRAIMEIKNCDFQNSKEIVAEFVKKGYSIYQMYAKIQEWLGDKILVDKTTTYASNIDYLKRAEAYFDEPFYIQIVRNPAAMIQSYLDSNLEQVFGSELPFEAREKAELFWIINNGNILEFFENVPDKRRIIIKYEEMVKNPDKVIKEICDKIGIKYEPVMIKPYQGKRMLDGVHKESKMVGDPRFHTHKEIDSSLAEKWQIMPAGDELNKITLDIAKKLNFKIAVSNQPIKQLSLKLAPREKPLPLSFSQERLWFLDQLDPNNSAYNIPGVVKLKGKLNIAELKNTIKKIFDRHEILRCSIETENGKGYNKIYSSSYPNIIIENIVHTNGKDIDSKIKDIVQKEIRKPFILRSAPLLRIKILVVNEDEHIFILTMHHIISDGWSVGVFIKEFSEIYSSLIQHKNPNLPVLDVQYIDYAYWQREYLKGKLLADQLNFWKKYLDGAPPLLELPTDKPRPSVQTFNGTIKKFEIQSELSEGINKYCKNSNITPFMFLLTAFQVLLYKYSGQNDICTGIPIANRSRAEFENLIGFFVNTIVIRNQINSNDEFPTLLKQVRDSAVSAFAHQEIPFEKIVDSLDIDRDVSHSPLFQVMFTYQNLPKTKIEIPDLELEAIELDTNISKFDLSLTMMEGKSGFTGAFEYNTDLFEDETIERMIFHFEDLLKNLLSNPEIPIEKIPLIDNNEQLRILDKINSAKDIPRLKKFVPKRFNEVSLEFPNNIAVVCDGRDYTYEQLNIDSNKLANYLLGKGINSESVVGIYLKRSYQAIVSLLGVLKAGAAYLPLEPNYPIERLEYMIIDSGTKLILTEDTTDNSIAIKGIAKNNLSVLWSEIEKEDSLMPKIKIDGDNLSYIIYTSGSTGKPKGTLITHKGLNNYLSWALHKYPLEKGIGSVVHSTLAFDATVTAVYPALLSGKTLHLVTDKNEIDGLKNILINNDKFSLVKITPAHLDVLSNLIKAEEAKDITHSFVIGGENLTAKQIQYWQKYAPDTLMFNEYGPTENVVGCIVYEASKYQNNGSVPIGKIIPGTEAYVLDTEMNIVPQGIPGELYLSGIALARGYKNRSDLTAEKFVPNPFSTKEGKRLYKTGDLVKLRNDDEFEFLGRIDDQVKVRGYRIELGEIESTINSHKDIEQSVVVVREYNSNIKRLVAYFVSGKSEIKNEELEKYLSEKLPEYMVPSFFVKLDKIPLTPNGKIDRKTLPEPKISDTISTEEFVAPTTEKENVLAEVWKEVLGFEKIGLNDNFFKLGGDSIVAIQMIAKAKQKGLQINPVQIFQNQTLQKLAMVAKEVNIVVAEQGLVKGTAPLTPIQQYFFENNFKEPNHWNQSIFLKVNDSLNEEKLKEAVRILLNHHDELRVTFEYKNDMWQQNIKEPPEEIPFEVVDLTATNSDSVKQIIEEYNKKYQASLNIEKGPVIKVVFYKISDIESRILIIVHHLVIDGISWRILIEDMITAYNLLLINKKVTLPSKSTSFKTWAEFINEFVSSEKILKEKDYWIKQADKKIDRIEKDFDEKDNHEKSLFNKSTILSKEETIYLLKDIHEKYNTQINDILLTGLLLAYNKWKGKRQLLLHLEGHGRELLSQDYDVSRTIGWFTALFPVYLNMKDEVELGEIIKSVKEDLRKIPNKGIGFGMLRYLLNDEALKNKFKVFDEAQITFNYLGQFDQSVPENSPFVMAAESKGADRGLENKRTSLIDVTAVVSQGEMSVSISANKNQFQPESIIEFLSLYKKSLQEIIDHCKGNDKVEYTSSDFDLIDLEDDQLNSVLDKLNYQDN